MVDESKVTQIQEILAPAKRVLVLVSREATADHLATALALETGLTNLGKQVTIASPKTWTEEFGMLSGVERLETELNNKDLMIAFDYSPEAVDKVTYHIDEESKKFYLLIQPQKNHPPLDSNSVEFKLNGVETDLIFLVGVHDLTMLDHLYEGQESIFESTTTISIHTFETEIGNIKLNLWGSSSLSEGIIPVIMQLGMTIDDMVATNLLKAIEETTDHFSSLSMSAEAFETVAWLLRQGARRSTRTAVTSSSSSFAAALKQKQLEPVATEPKKKKKNTETGGLDHQPGPGGVAAK